MTDKPVDEAEALLFLKQIKAYGEVLKGLGETLLGIKDIENLDMTILEAELIRLHKQLHLILGMKMES